ncbi:MAG: GAF domain-containing protein, partial [Terriglobia bacterium]
MIIAHMSESVPRPTSRAPHITALVATALAQTNLSGLSEMLKRIAEAMNAYGCILWRVTPGAPALGEDLSNMRLFVLAHWLKDNRSFALHDLPLRFETGKAGSVTGEAISRNNSVSVDDIWKDERAYKGNPFLGEAGIKTLCSVPITFLDGVRGAVNVYRTDLGAFRPDEIALLIELVSLVPALYQTIQDKVSLSLIRSVNEVLQDAETRVSDTPLSIHAIRKVFQTVCARVAETFQCIETSAFLEDHLEAP